MINVVDVIGQVQRDVAVGQPVNTVTIIIHSVYRSRDHRHPPVVQSDHQHHPLSMMGEPMVLLLVTGTVVKQVVHGQAKHP